MDPSRAMEWVQVFGALVIVLSNVAAIYISLRELKSSRTRALEKIEEQTQQTVRNQTELVMWYTDQALANRHSERSRPSVGSNGAVISGSTKSSSDSTSQPSSDASDLLPEDS